jgi:hypothetical protein
MAHYCRVYLRGKRGIILRIERETPQILIGIEVNREGDEVVPSGADQHRHMIQKAAITRRCCMSWRLKYGDLVPALKQWERHPSFDTTPVGNR